MTDKFACEITFMKNLGTMPNIAKFLYEDGVLVSSIPYLEDKGADIERDIFKVLADDSKKFKELETGSWTVFVTGEVFYESNLDWESGNEEGEYIFEEKEMIFTPLFDLQPKKIVVHVKRGEEKK